MSAGCVLKVVAVQTVMKSMGRAMMGTGQAEGENRASDAAMAALHNPLLDTHGFASAKVCCCAAAVVARCLLL